MSKDVKIPDIGGFEGVEVIDVLVSEGDKIEKEDSLITLESDKAAMDVPAPFAGTVKELKVKTGDKVSEGDVILVVEEGGDEEGEEEGGSEPKKKSESENEGEERRGEDKGKDEEKSKKGEADEEESEADEEKKGEEEDKKDEKKAKRRKPDKSKEEDGEEEREKSADGEEQKEKSSRKGAATPPMVDRISEVKAHAGPSVRKFARELGVDLSQVSGSGHKNRVTHEDVKHYVKSALRGGGTGGGLPAVPEVDFSRFGEVETKPLSRIKRISGPRLQAAWVNAPHVTQHDEADITALETVRKAMNADAGEDDAKLTLLAFLVHAVVLAMQAYPDFNAALASDGENLIVRKYFHVGFAVDTEGGLLVPVIRDADKKDLRAIAAELARLAEAARGGKLKREEMEGGCFSISSLGSIGGTAFTPIVNAPEVAVLGVSRAEMKPKWNGSEFAPRLMLPLSLSYDHRVIDGAQAVRFTRHLAQTLETLRGFVS